MSRDVPLPGILNQEAKDTAGPEDTAVSWLCCQVTFLAQVKQLGIITVKKSKQEEQQMHRNKQIA